jgi:hypothetical protein
MSTECGHYEACNLLNEIEVTSNDIHRSQILYDKAVAQTKECFKTYTNRLIDFRNQHLDKKAYTDPYVQEAKFAYREARDYESVIEKDLTDLREQLSRQTNCFDAYEDAHDASLTTTLVISENWADQYIGSENPSIRLNLIDEMTHALIEAQGTISIVYEDASDSSPEVTSVFCENLTE